MFSKLRTSITGIYVWRLDHAADEAEKQSTAHAADFAFRQVLALCPYNPETVRAYTDFLNKRNRGSDAQLVAEMAAKMPEMKGRHGQQIRNLVRQLEQNQR